MVLAALDDLHVEIAAAWDGVDLQYGTFDRGTPRSDLEAETQRVGFDPSGCAQCQNHTRDAFHLFAFDYLENLVDDISGQRKLVHAVTLGKSILSAIRRVPDPSLTRYRRPSVRGGS